MRWWKKMGLSIGTALVAARFWRKSTHDEADYHNGESDSGTPPPTGETEVWIELDVEPLFPLSQPVGWEYPIDLDTDPDGDPLH